MNHTEMKRIQAELFSWLPMFITVMLVKKLTGVNGLAYLVLSAEFFGFIHILTSGGCTGALAKLLRMKLSKGYYKNAVRLKQNVMVFQIIIGLSGSALMLLLAGLMADKVFQVKYLMFIIILLSPCILFRAVTDVLLGYLNGSGSEMPAAVAVVFRQLMILGFSLVFTSMLKNYGLKVSKLLGQDNYASMYGGVGVALAVTLTELLMIVFLVILYRGVRNDAERKPMERTGTYESFYGSVRSFNAARLHGMLIRLLLWLLVYSGTLVYFRITKGSDDGVKKFGELVIGIAYPCAVMIVVSLLFLVPVVGKAMLVYRRDGQRAGRLRFQSLLHLSVVLGLFGTVFIASTSEAISAMLDQGRSESFGNLLQFGSLFIVLFILTVVAILLLTAFAQKLLVFLVGLISNMIAGMGLWIMCKNGMNVSVVLVSGELVIFGIQAVVLWFFSLKQVKLKPDWLRLLFVPLLASAGMGLINIVLVRIMMPHLGEGITLIVCFAVSLFSYWFALLLLRNFKETELESMPGGRIIIGLGQMFHVY